jgi:transcriptional regulator NrdR family protein
MGLAIDIVKQDGRRPSEQFSKEKLHASIVAACLSVRTPIGQAEAIAHDAVVSWLESKPEVTSQDLRRIAAGHLHTHHPDAAYIYQQHRITI